MQGLSEWAIAQLKFLRASNAIPDTDLGTLVKLAVEADDKKQEAEVRQEENKLLQLFMNVDLFKEVYKNELDAPMHKPTEVAPEQVDFDKLTSFMKQVGM